MDGTVKVKVFRLVKQREEEQIGVGAGTGSLAGAAHVGLGRAGGGVGVVRVEALRPSVPTGAYGSVHHGEGWGHTIRRKAFLVEVQGDAWHVRRPRLLDHLRGIVEGSS